MAAIKNEKSIRFDILLQLLKPVALFCMRRSHFSFQDFVEIAKVAFIRAAEEELGQSTQKVNVSRISVLTGIYREEVTRIYKKG